MIDFVDLENMISECLHSEMNSVNWSSNFGHVSDGCYKTYPYYIDLLYRSFIFNICHDAHFLLLMHSYKCEISILCIRFQRKYLFIDIVFISLKSKHQPVNSF